ncbi:MAG: hypothetical protein IBX45_03160 [Campylobacterales bacterium]|nr:hypothetical protein [Campylobacterales bacterium]
MDELLRMSVMLHLFFVLGTLGTALLHLGLLVGIKDAQRLGKKIHVLIPAYYLLLSGLFFTGLIALAVMHFHVTHWVGIMLVVWVVMLGGSIKTYSLFKKTKFHLTEETQGHFVRFAKKKYALDALMLALLFVLA